MSQEGLGALHVLVHLIQHIKETKQIKWFAGVHNQKVKSGILNHTIWFQNYGTSLVNPQGNQSWIFIGRTETEAEAPVLWPPDVTSQLIRKDPDDGKDWRQEENGMIDDKMVEWHHQFIEHESEKTLGDGEGQGTWRVAVHGVAKSRTRLSDWTTNVYAQPLSHVRIFMPHGL